MFITGLNNKGYILGSIEFWSGMTLCCVYKDVLRQSDATGRGS